MNPEIGLVSMTLTTVNLSAIPDAPGFVASEQIGRRSAPGFILEIDICERLTIAVLHNEAGVGLVDSPVGGGKRRRLLASVSPGVQSGCRRVRPSMPFERREVGTLSFGQPV